MLSGLFGRKVDHPLAGIKSTQALLDDLPKNDAHKSLMQLTEWIESVVSNTDFKVDMQLAVLCLLDETAQPYLRKLTRDYFALQDQNKFLENRLWLVLDDLCRNTAKAYYAIFCRYRVGDKGASAIRTQLPLLTARAIHAMSGQLKYASAHYGPVNKTIWENLAQLYQHAEQQHYLDLSLVTYNGMGGNTTVKDELAHLLGWYGCGVNTLKPLHMHLTERIVRHYCTGIHLGTQHDENSIFCFDLAHPAAPVRKTDTSSHHTIRFINMSEMQPKLASLVKTLGKGAVPDSLNLGGTYDIQTVSEVAQYLLNFITAPPLRRNMRHVISASLSVVTGFDKLAERCAASTAPDEDEPVHWDVEDISSSGFRTILSGQKTEDICIGSLLGVRPGWTPRWGAAVVRRLTRDDANRLHVGVELLTNQVAIVHLDQSGGGVSNLDEIQTALWLQAKPGVASGEVQLLMKSDTFFAYRSLQTTLSEKRYLLIPVRMQEKGHDYDLAVFRAIEQESEPEPS